MAIDIHTAAAYLQDGHHYFGTLLGTEDTFLEAGGRSLWNMLAWYESGMAKIYAARDAIRAAFHEDLADAKFEFLDYDPDMAWDARGFKTVEELVEMAKRGAAVIAMMAATIGVDAQTAKVL